MTTVTGTTIPEISKSCRAAMERALENSRREFASIRSGKATTSLLDTVRVEAYGSHVPLAQVANVSAPEPRLLTLTVWDKGQVHAVEKAIRDSDLGLNPQAQGNVIRVPIPALNEERRRDLVKVARHIAEEGRVGIRNVRRDVMHDLRELKNEGEVGEDDEKRAEAELQKLTDERVGELDGLLKQKEAEILEV